MSAITKQEMHHYILTVDYNYLIGMRPSERIELCKTLIEYAKDFPQYEVPKIWEDCIKNPGVWNELSIRKIGHIGE